MHVSLNISSPVPTFHNCLRKGDISGGYEDTDVSDDVVSEGYGDKDTSDDVVSGGI